MSDRPTEHMAMIRPRRMPSAKRWAIRSVVEVDSLWEAPVKKLTILVAVTNESPATDCSAGLSADSANPSGRVLSSIRTT